MGIAWCSPSSLHVSSVHGEWLVYCDIWPWNIFVKSTYWLHFTTGIIFALPSHVSFLNIYFTMQFDPEESDSDMSLPTRETEEFRYTHYMQKINDFLFFQYEIDHLLEDYLSSSAGTPVLGLL
jgi:hypothetical protein